MEEEGGEKGEAFLDLVAQRWDRTRPRANTRRLEYIAGGLSFKPPVDRVKGAPPRLPAEAEGTLSELPAGPRTPVSAEAIRVELAERGYANAPLARYLDDALTKGADIHVRVNDDGLIGRYLAHEGTNWSSASQHPEAMQAAIDDAVARGVLIRTTAPVLPSPMAARLKKNGKIRPIADLSNSPDRPWSVNDGIPQEGRSAPTVTVSDVMATLAALPDLPEGQHYCGFSVDISNAYNLIPIRPDMCYLVGQYWEGAMYFASSLVFGLASAPLIFSALAAVVLWIITDELERITDNVGKQAPHRTCLGTVFVDDYLLVFPDQYATAVRDGILQLLQRLRVPVDPSKTQLGSRVTWVGYEWRLDTLRLHVEPKKQMDLLERLSGHLAAGQLSRNDARSLAGALQFTLVSCPPARVYLQRLYAAINSTQLRSNMITLSPPMRADLEFLSHVLEDNVGKAHIKVAPRVVIFTDAALDVGPPPTGHGGFYALSTDTDEVGFGHFDMPQCVTTDLKCDTEETVKISSTLYEYVGACVALDTLIVNTGLRDCAVTIVCDNRSLVETLSVGRAISPACNRALRALLATAAAAQISLFAVHLCRERQAIQIADSLSRSSQDMLRTALPSRRLVEWQPDPSRFRLSESQAQPGKAC